MEIDGVTQVDTTMKMGGAAPTQDELKNQLQQLQDRIAKAFAEGNKEEVARLEAEVNANAEATARAAAAAMTNAAAVEAKAASAASAELDGEPSEEDEVELGEELEELEKQAKLEEGGIDYKKTYTDWLMKEQIFGVPANQPSGGKAVVGIRNTNGETCKEDMENNNSSSHICFYARNENKGLITILRNYFIEEQDIKGGITDVMMGPNKKMSMISIPKTSLSKVGVPPPPLPENYLIQAREAKAAAEAAAKAEAAEATTKAAEKKEAERKTAAEAKAEATFEKYKPLLKKNYYTNYLISHLHKKYINGDIIDDKKCKLIIYLMFLYEGGTIKSWKGGLYEILYYYLNHGYEDTLEEYKHILNGIEEFATKYIDPRQEKPAVSQEQPGAEDEGKPGAPGEIKEKDVLEISMVEYLQVKSDALKAKVEMEKQIYKDKVEYSDYIEQQQKIWDAAKKAAEKANGLKEKEKEKNIQIKRDEKYARELQQEAMDELNILEEVAKSVKPSEDADAQQDQGPGVPPPIEPPIGSIEGGQVWEPPGGGDNGVFRCWFNAPLYTILQNEAIRGRIRYLYEEEEGKEEVKEHDLPVLKSLYDFMNIAPWKEDRYVDFINQLIKRQKTSVDGDGDPPLPNLIEGISEDRIIKNAEKKDASKSKTI